jgi:hypothetical protein
MVADISAHIYQMLRIFPKLCVELAKSCEVGCVYISKMHPCTALRLCTGRTARRGSRGIALPFLDYGTRRG